VSQSAAVSAASGSKPSWDWKYERIVWTSTSVGRPSNSAGMSGSTAAPCGTNNSTRASPLWSVDISSSYPSTSEPRPISAALCGTSRFGRTASV
jgi:hypothetical protein